jgi:hypothetical protein
VASFFSRVVAQVNPFDKGKSFGNPQGKPTPKPQPRPKVNVAQLQQAFHDAHNGPYTQQGPGFQSYQNVAKPAPRPTPQPIAHPGVLGQDLSGQFKNLLVGSAQAIPRGLVRIDRSVMPGPHQNFTPTTTGQKILLGNQPIQTYGKENKQHGNGLTGALAVAGSLLGDLPGIPGKKQAAEEVGKVAKGIKIGKNINKPVVQAKPKFASIDEAFKEMNRPKAGKQGVMLSKPEIQQVNDLFANHPDPIKPTI